jgi:Mrp family chromosome partitioning ATPase/uncharacterized protein involved in exopolysaccharide biosynthesis
MTTVSANSEAAVAAQVGNPLLGQIRDFIDSDEPTPIDPLGIITRAVRGRALEIGLVAIAIAVLFALLAWLAISPGYQSTGVVRILPREAKLLYTDSDDSRLRLYDAFTNAEVHLMQARPVLETAWHSLHDLHHGASNEAFTMPKDAGELSRLISITNRKGLVTVAAKSGDPLLSAAAVNAVLAAYETHKDRARDRVNDVRRSELQEREKQLAATLEELDARYLDIGGEHDMTSLSKAHIAKTAQLEILEERIGELDNTIAQFQRTGAVGADDIRNAEIQRALLLDQAMADMTYERAGRLADLATLRSRYRPTHRKIVTAELELETLEAAIEERRDQITTLGNVGALTGGTSQSSEQSLEELQSVRQKLLERRTVLSTEANELIGKLVKIRRVVAEQQRVGKLLDTTKRALDEVIVESQAGLSRSIDIIARGKVPDRPIDDKRKPVALGAAFFGALATLIGFLLSSLLNPRIRYSDDFKPDVAQKIVVALPDADDKPIDRMRAGFQLRNEIDMRRPNADTPIVIAVAGGSPAAATSEVTLALSSAFSAREMRLLLIDANTNRRVTGEFALDGKPGLTDVMRDHLELSDAASVATISHGNVDILGAGVAERDDPSDRVAAFTIQDFRKLLDAAASAYDVVVLDLGELAAGRHSALAASVSDQLVLVTAAGDKKRDVENTVTLLERIAPDRYLLIFDRASRLDPLLEHGRDSEPQRSWPADFFKPFKRILEFK